ncbi:hypothetical protein IWX83_002916 [Flavobacterium sp. CG_9.1]|uniref:PorT family protein n=1 Tax=Flavobacterium sp. CG_9.1 TaxID=2787728 RepID=UPI0018C9E719|nr:PorT family protein [Flavobacterium sp. CG_9.1]MBG6063107.1 hypothetical protein [Flavobacterium sp. CG_9.1]
MRKLTLVLFLILVSVSAFSQYTYRDSNRIGISFGGNQFSLNTNNFEAKPDLGWNAGLSMRGNFYNNLEMVYSMQFSENNFSVATINSSSGREDVAYKLASGQVALLVSYVIIQSHLSIEFGPIVQVNGKLNLDSSKENNVIAGTTLLAKDIKAISNFNFYPTIGITFGVRHFRANVSYQYGVNNMLENLNKKNLGVNFKGNPGILNGNLIIYL